MRPCRFILGVLSFGSLIALPVLADDFASSMNTAMQRMDHAMMVPPSGNADRDFAAMMIPHHQGAIDMAQAELHFGHDPALRRLAQRIITDQQREIVTMRRALDRLAAASGPAAGTPAAATPAAGAPATAAPMAGAPAAGAPAGGMQMGH